MEDVVSVGPRLIAPAAGPKGGRVPPHSLEAERGVLGGVLLDNEALHVVLQLLKKDDFYSEANARLFDAIGALYSAGTPIDTITLRAEIVSRGQLQSVGGDEYLLELTQYHSDGRQHRGSCAYRARAGFGATPDSRLSRDRGEGLRRLRRYR